jgi:hypothetical protein
LDKPLVVLFDDADLLSGSTLLKFLATLRNGYANRDIVPFINSLGLAGTRNIVECQVEYQNESEALKFATPFNVISEHFTLKDFAREQVGELYSQ